MNQKSQHYLLALARQTLVDYFTIGEKLKINENDLPDSDLAKIAATFVTLTKEGELRGCIGNLVPKKKLYEDVVNNTLLAGFGDPRFVPLEEAELKQVKIEISVLSDSHAYKYHSPEELLGSIKPGEHGVILQLEYAQSTFLPQVWEDLPDKKEFLKNLSQKAGLPEDAWMNPQAELFYYTVENFSE